MLLNSCIEEDSQPPTMRIINVKGSLPARL